MATTKRLTRRDIHEDEVLSGFGRGVHFLEEHRRELLYVVVGAVVIALGAGAIVLYRAARARQASEILGRALDAAQAPIVAAGDPSPAPGEPTPEISFASEAEKQKKVQAEFAELKKVSGAYGPAGAVVFHEASELAAKGDLDGARTRLEEFARRHQGSLPGSVATLNAIRALRAQGKHAETLGKLTTLLTSGDAALPQDTVLYEMARTYEAQRNFKEARVTYERISAEHPDSPYAVLGQAAVQSLPKS